MFWEFVFWFLVVMLVLPFPFKVIGYLKGTDSSKAIVKIEEMSNALFTSFGLAALYGYINDVTIFTPLVWKIWLVIAVLWSVLAIFWSPKLTYASEIFGKNKMRVLASISTLIHAPLFVGVYLYAYAA